MSTAPASYSRSSFTHFSKSSSIYYIEEYGAQVVRGDVRARWASLGWERGPLGFVSGPEGTTPDGRARYQHFGEGSIYRTSSGAHALWGGIHGQWAFEGYERSWCGYPTTTQARTPGGRDYVHFSGRGGCSMYGHGNAFLGTVSGPVRDHYASLGWERSWLGYPRWLMHESPEYNELRGTFDGGYLTWNTRTRTMREHGRG